MDHYIQTQKPKYRIYNYNYSNSIFITKKKKKREYKIKSYYSYQTIDTIINYYFKDYLFEETIIDIIYNYYLPSCINDEYIKYINRYDSLNHIKLYTQNTLSHEFIHRYHNRINWKYMLKYQSLTYILLNMFDDKILSIQTSKYNYSINLFCFQYKIKLKYLYRHRRYFKISELLRYQKLNDKFILNYMYQISNPTMILYYQPKCLSYKLCQQMNFKYCDKTNYLDFYLFKLYYQINKPAQKILKNKVIRNNILNFLIGRYSHEALDFFKYFSKSKSRIEIEWSETT